MKRHARLNRVAVVGMLVAVAAASCARQAKEGTGPVGANDPSENIGIDWSNPDPAGVAVMQAEAAQDLTFSPVYPQGISAPYKMTVTDPSTTAPGDRIFSLVYRDPTYGPFLVTEEMSAGTQAELEGLATCDPTAGCVGQRSLVTLNNATTALEITGPASNGVLWLRNGVLFDVLGPPSTFTASHAVAIANDM